MPYFIYLFFNQCNWLQASLLLGCQNIQSQSLFGISVRMLLATSKRKLNRQWLKPSDSVFHMDVAAGGHSLIFELDVFSYPGPGKKNGAWINSKCLSLPSDNQSYPVMLTKPGSGVHAVIFVVSIFPILRQLLPQPKMNLGDPVCIVSKQCYGVRLPEFELFHCHLLSMWS